MTFNKKINAKNAFDVDANYIENLARMLNQKEETSWQTASNGLEAFAQIYSYRVDSVHTELFKILGGLHRNMIEEKLENADGQEQKENKKKVIKNIEENIEKLNIKEFDLGYQIDPLFKQTTTMFSQINAKGLLQYCLEINNQLELVLEGTSTRLEAEEEIIEGNNFPSSHSKASLGKLTPRIININSNSTISQLISNYKKSTQISNVSDLLELDLCANLEYFKKGGKNSDDVGEKLNFSSSKKNRHSNHISEEKRTKEKKFLDQFHQQVESSYDRLNNNNDFLNENYLKADEDMSNYDNGLDRIQDNDMFDNNDFDDGNNNYDNNSKSSNFNEFGNQNQFNNIKINAFNYNNPYNDVNKDKNMLNYNNSNNISILMFKPGELQDHLSKFGAGDSLMLNQMNQTAKIKTDWEIGKAKKDPKQRPKKEQKLFNFENFFSKDKGLSSEKEEELLNTLFIRKDNKKKNKNTLKIENTKKLDKLKKRKKLTEGYNYKNTILFTQFTNKDKLIINQRGEKQANNNINDNYENNNAANNDFENNFNDDANIEGNNSFDYNNNNPEDEVYEDFNINNNNVISTNNKIMNSNYKNSDMKMNQNQLERLYRVVDVRKIKAKLWENIEKAVPKKEIVEDKIFTMSDKKNENQTYDITGNFSQLVSKVKNDSLSGVTPSTCFVCLLHLCNEKGKLIIVNYYFFQYYHRTLSRSI